MERPESAQIDGIPCGAADLDNGEGGWQNLSSWLVRSGLAMIVPCERDLPEPKVSAAEYQKQLETDEAEAKHSRTGAWAR